MVSQIKILFFFLIIAQSAFAVQSPRFQKFEIVELNGSNVKENKKPAEYLQKNRKASKYGLIISNNHYNKTSKNIIIVPVILKSGKEYAGRFIHSFQYANKTYIIFADKIRTVSKGAASNSSIALPSTDEDKINKILENILR